MNAPTCGSLFSGIGLLDFGLHLAGWEHRWFCESDEFRRGVLRQRFPGAVVYDDVRTLRGPFAADAERDGVREQSVAVAGRGGAAVAGRAGEAAADARGRGARRATAEPPRSGTDGQRPARSDDGREALHGSGGRCASRVDLIAGGFPCKGASTAGKRQGFGHAETVLWHEMRRVIGEVRPRYVVIENVANILGMAAAPGEPAGSLWGSVLADLAALGFGDIRWDCVPAGAVGAPHLRDRVFCVAVHSGWAGWPAGRQSERAGGERPRHVVDEGSAAAAADSDDAHGQGHRGAVGVRAQVAGADGVYDRAVAVDWGDYRPAIERWEAIHGPAPEPLVRRLDDGDPKLRRVRARVDRSRLSALGDGVHVYVGWLVGEYVMSLERGRAAA